MKKFLSMIATGVAASQTIVMSAWAALPPPDTISYLSTELNIKTAIASIIAKVLDFILIVAVLYVVIAGIRLIVSGGDDGAKDKAKNTIFFVIAGIVIILFARVIVSFVNTALG